MKRNTGILLLLFLGLTACVPGNSPATAMPTPTLLATPVAELIRPTATQSSAPTTTGAPSPTPAPSATTTHISPWPTPIATSSPTQPTAGPPASRVLIISVDGLRPDALSEVTAPNILALARHGAFSWRAQTVLPSVTLIAHASMLSGVPPTDHAITWNDYRPAVGTITVPTVFSQVEAAGGKTVMVISKPKLQHLAAPGAVDDLLNLAAYGDVPLAGRAAEVLANGFDLMFIHLSGVDAAGHLTGWMSASYLNAVRAADRAIGEVLAAVDGAGLQGTLVIITADHGGEGVSHGRNIPADTTIPWVMAGPGVRENYAIEIPVSIMDTAATALYVLGLPVPANWEGQAIVDAFVQQPALP
jgi:hypothetical protein